MRIGIVACGYADGYPRHAGTGTPVLVDGVRTGTVGRVSMDMLAVDLTPVPQAGRQRGHAVGPRPGRQPCWPSTRWRAPPAPSATS
jgi:alanine racemase